MRAVYLVLAGVVVVAVIVSVVFPDTEWVNRFFPGIATEAIGILLTLVFVQQFLQRQERVRRLRASVGALRKGNRALSSIALTWATILRDAIRRDRPSTPASLHDLFVGELTEQLVNWDPTVPIRGGGLPGEPSGAWASRSFAEAQDALNDIIATYGGSLDPNYVEAIDHLIDDPFLRQIRDVLAHHDPGESDWRARWNTSRSQRDAHFQSLLAAIVIQNRLSAEAGRYRDPRLTPRTSTVAIRLDPDHDLKVRTEVDPAWWRSSR